MSTFKRRDVYTKVKDKKVFILAIPTIVIIIVVAIGMLLIFYNRNYKKMSRDDVKILSQKVAIIDNISCELVTNAGGIETVSDYKMKGNRMVCKTDGFTTYDNKDEQKIVQLVDSEKRAYTYSNYKSEIDDFRAMICSVAKSFEDEKYSYQFQKYETINGIKCVNFILQNDEVEFNIWLDRTSGMIVKMICHNKSDNQNETDSTLYFRYQIGNVSESQVQKPDLSGFEVTEL